MPAETRPKKQVSERRRQQNKQAQKNYRERQKRNLELLQGFAADRSRSLFEQATSRGQPLAPSSDGSSVFSAEFNCASDPNMTRSELLSTTRSLDGPFYETTERDILRRLSRLSQQGYGSLDEELRMRILEKKVSLETILKAGLTALSLDSSPDSKSAEDGHGQYSLLRTDKILVLQNMDEHASRPLPDIHRNNLRIKQVLFTAACVANASALGLGYEAASCEYDISPFFQESATEDMANAICSNSFQDLKEHLRPCASQVMRAHHPYIDVLPFPTFRDRILKLAYGDSPMVDEEDLCKDLENDGLICWGSSLGGGSAATGSGAPWDLRSWEAQPWFLRKWWILIGGAEGEIFKQTQWWCEMRGERSCYPW